MRNSAAVLFYVTTPIIWGGILSGVSAVPIIDLPVTASTLPVESDWTAVSYSTSPLLFGNDGSTAAGGFRAWSLKGTPLLTEISAQVLGRTKLVATVYDVGNLDLVVTIAQTDSTFRVFDAETGEQIKGLEKEAIGDWSAVCTWKSPESGNQYFYLFGKNQARQYLLQQEKLKVEIVEIQTFNLPIEATSCVVPNLAKVLFFSGDDDATIYSMGLNESATAPAVGEAGKASDHVTGLAVYTTTSSEHLLVAQAGVIEVYSTAFELQGSMTLTGAAGIEIQGLAVYQGVTDGCPAGCLTYAIESDDGKAFGISSLEPMFSALQIELNTEFDPRSKCQQCEETICQRCNFSGFCGNGDTNCDCFAGLTGESCETVTCTEDCSGHGFCVGPNVCRCEDGWRGLHCSFLLVQPQTETDANGIDGDDPAVWISPSSLDQSRVLTTTKSDDAGGLAVFNLEGKLLQIMPAAEPNNVDIIYGFNLGTRTVDLAYAACRGNNTLCIFELNSTGDLSEVAGGTQLVIPDYDVYGSCVYKSRRTGTQYVFVNDKQGLFLQYELLATPDGSLSTSLVRNFTGGSGLQVEGCVADEDNGFLFIGEEPEGLWRYNAEPEDPATEGVKVASVAAYSDHRPGDLFADVEGVTMVYGKGPSEGYIVVSCQGVSAYNVYRRAPPHAFVETFTITDSADGRVDHVSNTDGVTVVGTGLNDRFPSGLIVVHDDSNELPGGGVSAEASFKLVSLADVLRNGDLLDQVDTEWDPRT